MTIETKSFEGVAVAALVLAAAAMVTFSELSRAPSADTLLPAVISTQQLTWYFWGQNRLGNLWPMLASPIADIQINFAVQQYLKACMAAMSPLFLLQLLRPRVSAPAVYAAALIGMVGTVLPSVVAQFWVEALPYGTSITLMGSALWAGSRAGISLKWRCVAVFVLMLVATWVNIGIVLVTAPLFGLFFVVYREWRYAAMLACTLVCYGLVTLHSKSVPYASSYVDVKISWAAMEALVTTASGALMWGPAMALIAIFAAAGAVAIRVPAARGVIGRSLVVMLGCVVTMLIIATLNWFRINDHSPRYLALPLALIFGAAAIAVADVVAGLVPRAPRLRTAGGIGLCVAALLLVFQVAKPSLAMPTVSPAHAALAQIAVEEQATFIAGDYWSAWPAVFEANASDRSHRVYGLAWRGTSVMKRMNAAARPGAIVVCAHATALECTDKIKKDLETERLGGRPVDTLFETVRSGRYGSGALPYVVLRIRPL